MPDNQNNDPLGLDAQLETIEKEVKNDPLGLDVQLKKKDKPESVSGSSESGNGVSVQPTPGKLEPKVNDNSNLDRVTILAEKLLADEVLTDDELKSLSDEERHDLDVI